MPTFLVPFDNSERSERVLQHVICTAQGREALKIHLLNVCEPITAWEVRRFLKDEEITRMQQDAGEASLRRACDLLDQAGLTYEPHVVIGPIAKTIVDCALKYGCEHIFIGTRGHGGLLGMFRRSVAAKVIQRAQVPVTVVKGGR